MLRTRIELLERVLHSHGIDPDAAIQLINDREAETDRAPASSNVDDDLSATFDGALTLDESLNFDQDGEVRYFGPTSGRLLFRSSPKGRYLVSQRWKFANRVKTHQTMTHTSQTVLTQGLVEVNFIHA
jgi:hypothetical protein